MEVYLIRHTRPELPPGICYGQTDIGLTADFTEELAALRAKLPAVSPERVYSSPLRRCAEAAKALGGVRVELDSRLMELNFGVWEMMGWNAIPIVEMQAWSEDYVTRAPPQGESFLQLAARVAGFALDLRRQPISSAWVITHAGVVRAWLAQTMNMPLADAFRLEVDYGGVSKLSLGEPPRVWYVNR